MITKTRESYLSHSSRKHISISFRYVVVSSPSPEIPYSLILSPPHLSHTSINARHFHLALVVDRYPHHQTAHFYSLSAREMDPVLTVTAVSILLGSLIAFAFFANYFGKRKSEVQSIAKSELQPDPKKQNKPSQSKKSHLKAHSHSHADKV